MTFNYKIIADPGTDPSLIKDADYALSQWSNAIDGKGTLVVDIREGPSPSGQPYLANSDTTGVSTNTENGGHTVAESSAIFELATGQHASSLPDGTQADVVVNLSPDYVQNDLYEDPNPSSSSSSSIPANKTDAVSVIEHEIGHALGFSGWYPATATSPAALGPFESRYDSLVQFNSGGIVFTGRNAEAANNGQPVPLTDFPAGSPESSQNIYHLGTNLSGGQFGNDLMTGAFYQNGFRYTISPTDVAIIKDSSGLSAAGSAATGTGTTTTGTGSGADTGTTTTGTGTGTPTDTGTPTGAPTPPVNTPVVSPTTDTSPPPTAPQATNATPAAPQTAPSEPAVVANGNTPTALNPTEVNAVDIASNLNHSAGDASKFFFDGSHLGADFNALKATMSNGQSCDDAINQTITDMKQLLGAWAADPAIATGFSVPNGPTMAIPGQFVADVINAGLKADVIGSAPLDQAYGGALTQFFAGAQQVMMGIGHA